MAEPAIDVTQSRPPPPAWTGRMAWLGIGLFVVFNLVVFVLVALQPDKSSVVPVYRYGALGWWQGQDIFGTGEGGFIYLPSFAVLYTPFALLGPQWGDVCWRLLSDLLLALAMWRVVERLAPSLRLPVWQAWGIALLLLLPSSFGALRNGQATTILLALMLFGALALLDRDWWRAAVLLALSFAIKPLAIVFLLLAAALYPRLSWRLGVAIVGFLVLPLINPDFLGALHLYRLGIEKVFIAGTPTSGHWADLTGLLGRFDIVLSDRLLTAIRVAMALVTLWLAACAVRRMPRTEALLHVVSLSVVYLMVFSPRTEGNTYLMVGVMIGLHAPLEWSRRDGSRMARWLTVIALTFLVESIAYKPFNYWLQPLLALCFGAYLFRNCLEGGSGAAPVDAAVPPAGEMSQPAG